MDRSVHHAVRHDQWAVSDVLGSVLLVGITVTSFAALGLLVSNIPPPPDNVHAEIAVAVKPGPDQSWSTGDEILEVRHIYGEAIPQDGSTIIIDVNGASQKIRAGDLAFSGGTLDIGEHWSRTMLFNFNDHITLTLIAPRGSGTSVLTSTAVVTGETSCTTDNDPPHAIITQVPGNIDALLGNGSADIKALLVDICSNVDPFVSPILEYWFGNENRASIVMEPAGPVDTWKALVPPPEGDWGNRFNQELHYRIVDLVDDLGNVGNSPVQTDLVEPPPPTYYYVANNTPILGETVNFANMKSAADAGATGQLREALPAGGTKTTNLYGQSLSLVPGHSNAKWDKAASILGNHGQETKYKHDDDPSVNYLRVQMADSLLNSDQIISVKVVLTGKTNPDDALTNNDDGWRLQVCWTGQTVTGSTCSQKSGVLTSTTPDASGPITYDISNRRPGGGTWKWADINDLDVLINGQIVNGIRDGDWVASTIRLEIVSGPGYGMEQELTWDVAPTISTPGGLEIRYLTSQGQFQVEVWDWSANTWNARTSKPLGSLTMATWSDALSGNEWNFGDVKIRVVSLQTDNTKQALVHVDYARLAS